MFYFGFLKLFIYLLIFMCDATPQHKLNKKIIIVIRLKDGLR